MVITIFIFQRLSRPRELLLHGYSDIHFPEIVRPRELLRYKYLGKFERGQVNVSVEVLVKIAEAMQVTAASLLEDVGVQANQDAIDRINALICSMSEERLALTTELVEVMAKKRSS